MVLTDLDIAILDVLSQGLDVSVCKLNLTGKAVLDRDFNAFDTAHESVEILKVESLRLSHEFLLLFFDNGLCIFGKLDKRLL